MIWSQENGLMGLLLLMGWFAIWWLMPREQPRGRLLGGLVGLGAVLLLQALFLPPAGDLVRDGMFYAFGAAAILSAGLMVTNHNPVYAALWFAVTTLAVCGLFLLNSAPFLAAATIIVYAGAIVVTFLFVIMLAQQAGKAQYDQQPFQPVAASFLAFVLLGTLLFALQEWGGIGRQAEATAAHGNQDKPIAANPLFEPGEKIGAKEAAAKPNEHEHVDPHSALPGQFVSIPIGIQANPFSQAPESNPREIGSLRILGRSLFTDYLYFVELAGTVLLIATIGAIAISPRRAQGHF